MLSRTKLSEILLADYVPIDNKEVAQAYADEKSDQIYNYLLKEVFGFTEVKKD